VFGYAFFLVVLALLGAPLRALESSRTPFVAWAGRDYYLIVSWIGWFVSMPLSALVMQRLAYGEDGKRPSLIGRAYSVYLPAQVLNVVLLWLAVSELHVSPAIGALLAIGVAGTLSYLGSTYLGVRVPLQVGAVRPEEYVRDYRVTGTLRALATQSVGVLRDLVTLVRPLALAKKKGVRPYVLFGSDYLHASAGVRACHRLVHELNQHGLMACSLGCVNPEWDERRVTRVGYWMMRALSDPIVIYPEVVTGNPLKAGHVVRWILNTPGHLGGDTVHPDSELIFAWSKRYIDTDRILTVDVMERDLFNSDDLPPKTLDCFYMGKAGFRGVEKIALTDGMTEITREPNYPATRAELADLLRRTRILYTYDDCTALGWEALLCGCRVVLLPENRDITLADVERDLPDTDYDGQLARFMDETQHGWLT